MRKLMSEEIWLPIKESGGTHEVSNHGRVRSNDRYIECGKQRRFAKGIVYKQTKTSFGYMVVSFKPLGCKKIKQFKVHRLVASAFIKGGVKETVNHIDGDKTNNHVTNLEWATYKENNDHAGKELRKGAMFRSYRRKLSDTEVLTILTMRNVSGEKIGKVFGVSEFAALCLRRGQTYKHITRPLQETKQMLEQLGEKK